MYYNRQLYASQPAIVLYGLRPVSPPGFFSRWGEWLSAAGMRATPSPSSLAITVSTARGVETEGEK